MSSPETRPPRPVPWLFDVWGMALLAAATVVATLGAAHQVALLAGGLALVGLLARGWSRLALRRLSYVRRAVPPRAFCGDTLVLETSLGNRKALPLAWLEAWERVPAGLSVEGHTEPSAELPGAVWVGQGACLWPYRRARWRHTLHCRRRGAYTLGNVLVRSGDPFGLCEREAWLRRPDELIVYPRVVPLRRLAFTFHHPAVDALSRASLVADPTRTAGVREYRPGDPQRLVHWRATAHTGALQVRLLEPAASLRVWLALDAGAFDLPWALYRDTLFELTLSALASIAVYLVQAGHPVGLLVHGDPPRLLPPAAHPAQLEVLLEALARLEPRGSPAPLEAVSARLGRGSTVILATSDSGPDLSATIARLQQAGRQALLLLAGSGLRPTPLPAERLVRLLPGRELAATLEGRA